jgi:hypothetical protein
MNVYEVCIDMAVGITAAAILILLLEMATTITGPLTILQIEVVFEIGVIPFVLPYHRLVCHLIFHIG